MLHLFGSGEIIRDIYRVSFPYVGDNSVGTIIDLREPFLDFLRAHQPYLPLECGDKLFIRNTEIENELASAYAHNNSINDLNQAKIIGQVYNAEEKEPKLSLAEQSLIELCQRDVEFATIFSTVIHSIFVRPSRSINNKKSYGGSSSAAIGAIWLSLPDNLTNWDIEELYVHELAHHLLFIDERSFRHFDYNLIGKTENYAYSAILKLNRPIDKVVHSIVVGTELLLARRNGALVGRNVTVHPSTIELRKSVKNAIDSVYSLSNWSDLISERANEIVQRCREAIRC